MRYLLCLPKLHSWTFTVFCTLRIMFQHGNKAFFYVTEVYTVFVAVFMSLKDTVYVAVFVCRLQ